METKYHNVQIAMLYLILRNYHQHPKSGVIEKVESYGVKNKADLKKLEQEKLNTLSQDVIKTFHDYSNSPESKTDITGRHMRKYYWPLKLLLRENQIPVKNRK